MPPPFWIHCNICSAIYSKDVRVFMLSCYHMLCKNCMMKTEKGKKCPICKAAIQFRELNQLPENKKAYFNPDAIDEVQEIVTKVKFQRRHQQNLVRLLKASKAKFKKASQIVATQDQELRKMKAGYKNLVEQRQKMQEKLKQIYREQQIRQTIYREKNQTRETFETSIRDNTNTSSVSSSTIAGSRLNNTPFSRPAPPQSALNQSQSFFSRDAPMLRSSQLPSSRENLMVSQSSKTTRQPFFG